MITVNIGGESRDIGDASESWVTQRVSRLRKEGQSACVRVVINLSGLNMRLSTPACVTTSSGGRAPNANEREVFALWEKLGLNCSDFSPGSVVAFLKKFRRLAAA